MNALKIAYARTQFWFGLKSGGSVSHTLGVLRGLNKKGCGIRVLANEAFFGIDDFDYRVIRPRFKKPGWLGELLYNFYARGRFAREIIKFSPDYIYHRFSGHTFFIAGIAAALRIPLILEFNSFDSWKLLNWEASGNMLKRFVQKKLLYRIVRRIEYYNLRKAFLVTVVSEPLKKDLVGIGIPEDKIMVNYNGVDTDKFDPEVSGSLKCREIKEKLGLGGNELVVGFSGTFGPWHGIPQLTEAIEAILKKDPSSNMKFLIIGDGGELKKKMFERLSGYSNVIFAGTVPYDDIQYFLGACDILVSPHCRHPGGEEFFGSPTKIFEYMAMGKGIVASRLGQIGEVLEHEKTAILTEPGNAGEIVSGILRLAGDEDLRKRLGTEARKAVLDKYTWDKNIERLLEKIDSMSRGVN
ncbi:MAG: glycosyltransferase family 4 protein [Actinobacteria bacterium]|nr:glycosyltransferase family 4 protein [Actinomycetota bacterium]